jgi:glyoxylase-like metal-dependent hydrolase (beta-lactamase superfamily II)
MTIRIERPALILVSCFLALSCSKERRSQRTEPEKPAESSTLPVSPPPEPALSPASRSLEAPKKLGMEIVTGSPEGFRVNSTILTGEKSALVIDAQFTLADARKLADAVAATKKELTTVYVTHAHPDHYFGFPAIKERFPNAKLVALPATVSEIEKTWAAKVKEWQPKYKDGITSKPVVPEALKEPSLDVDGEKLEIVGGLQGDEANNSYVWIPSLRAAVTGDIVYDGVFPWTAETTPETRKAWVGTIDRLIALKPERIVPGHQKPARKQEPASLDFTREYLGAYDDALAVSKSAEELQGKMKRRYPDTELDTIVKMGAEASFANKKTTTAATSEPKAQPTAPVEPSP